MVNIYIKDLKSFVIKVIKKEKESLIGFSREGDRWIGKTISGSKFDNSFPGHFTISKINSIFNFAYGYSVLKSINGWDVYDVSVID